LLPSNSRIAERLRKSSFWHVWLRRPALDVAEHILRLRRLRGMSQEELAGRMGTKQPAIARLEAGRSNPRLDTLVKAAEALDAVVRVQFAPTEDAGRRIVGRNWWDAEGASGRDPDVTFNVAIAVTILTASSRAPAELAATGQLYASFDATNAVAWPTVHLADTPALMAAGVPNGA
jgi:transcriptional regulator with XRE-family HTH domain